MNAILDPVDATDTPDLLDRVYRRFRWSERLMDVAAERAAASGVARAAVEVTLENALMRQLLDVPAAVPVQLFARLDRAGLLDAMRFSDIPEAVRPALAQTLVDTIASAPLEWAMDVSPPDVRLEPHHLTVGSTRIERNRWVDGLIALGTERLGPERGLRAVAASRLRYATIYAKTRHIGPPQAVYDDFHAWGVRHEGFASPFNARLLGKPDSWFYSAFRDTDGPFGSRGSFFANADPSVPGAWCLDPPFLDATMDRVVDRIAAWRDAEGPTVLLIGPASYAPRIPADEIVALKAGRHVYEGLAGTIHPLPVDVNVWRFGALPGFSAERILAGYTPKDA